MKFVKYQTINHEQANVLLQEYILGNAINVNISLTEMEDWQYRLHIDHTYLDKDGLVCDVFDVYGSLDELSEYVNRDNIRKLKLDEYVNHYRKSYDVNYRWVDSHPVVDLPLRKKAIHEVYDYLLNNYPEHKPTEDMAYPNTLLGYTRLLVDTYDILVNVLRVKEPEVLSYHGEHAPLITERRPPILQDREIDIKSLFSYLQYLEGYLARVNP